MTGVLPFRRRRIVNCVAWATGVPVAAMRGRLLWPADIIEARHLAMWATRRLTGQSTTQIGAFFRRHHTTVLQAVAKIERRRDEDAGYRRRTDILMAACRQAMSDDR
jgi:chromosomal replication initiation ATPase DnaA